MADISKDVDRKRMRTRPEAAVPKRKLKKGDQGDEVTTLYRYLKRFGYFPNPELRKGNALFRSAMPFDPEDTSKFDDVMEKAVRKFQKQHGLKVTGTIDDETIDLMRRPRCGFPDEPMEHAATGDVESFVVHGNRWTTNDLRFIFSNFSPDLTQAQQRTALRSAFDQWAAVTPLNFTESNTGGEIRIGWFSGDHGDGSPFDGVSNTLAHCFYPPPNGGEIAGDCHFDEAETWSVNTPPSGIDLLTVALHELGHGLGLRHSDVSSAVMYAYYGGPRRELTADDIQGIRSIYGTRFRWASLGGVIFNPVVGRNQDGRMEVFVRGSDNALWHKWQTARNNGWSGWASLGGGIQATPAVANNLDGRFDVFVRGNDGALWHKWQTAPNNGWSGWASLGGFIYDPVVGRNADGRIEVFVRGGDNALWHKWQTAPNNGWSGWGSLGGVMGSTVATANNADGRLEVFVRGTDGALWHRWQTARNNGWSGWASLGGQIIGAPVVARNADGRLEVFVRGMNNALWHKWQVAPNSAWSGWASLGGGIASPVATTNADGRIEVFVRGNDNALWHIWQTRPSNGWSGWASLGGVMTQGPAAGRNHDGRLEVFVRGTDNALWHTWQSAPNNGWS